MNEPGWQNLVRKNQRNESNQICDVIYFICENHDEAINSLCIFCEIEIKKYSNQDYMKKTQ